MKGGDRKVTESRTQNGNSECKSPWHSLKVRWEEGDDGERKSINIAVQGVKMKSS